MSTGGQIDCYTLPNVTSGDVVEFTESSIPRGLVVNASGSTVCSIPTASCSLGNGGPWLVLVFDTGASTFSYSLAARRLTNPQGCSSLGDPDVWSFTAPRLNGSLPGVLDVKCYTFSRAAGEADGSYWFRTVRTSGTLNPGWQVYGPAGSNQCSGSSGDYERCQLLTSGQVPRSSSKTRATARPDRSDR